MNSSDQVILDKIRNSFSWGFVDRVMFMGPYIIVEYTPRQLAANGMHYVRTLDHDRREYYAYLRTGQTSYKDLHCGYETLEHAMVGAIAQRIDGPNTRADSYFMAGLVGLNPGKELTNSVSDYVETPRESAGQVVCIACEGNPQSPNDPCSVCGASWHPTSLEVSHGT